METRSLRTIRRDRPRRLRGRQAWHPHQAMLRAEWRGAIRRQRRRTGHVKRGLLL